MTFSRNGNAPERSLSIPEPELDAAITGAHDRLDQARTERRKERQTVKGTLGYFFGGVPKVKIDNLPSRYYVLLPDNGWTMALHRNSVYPEFGLPVELIRDPFNPDPQKSYEILGPDPDRIDALTITDDFDYGLPEIPVDHIENFDEEVQDIVGAMGEDGYRTEFNYDDGTGKFTFDIDGITSGDIVDFLEAVQDVLGSTIAAGANINVSYNDGAGTLTIAVTGLTSAQISDFSEAVDDRVATLLAAGTGINLSYNDVGNILTISVSGLTPTDIAGFTEEVQDIIGAALTAGGNISVTYNDVANTITVAVTGLTSAQISDFSEAVDDRVATLLAVGTGINLSYNDVGNVLTISVSGLTSSLISDFNEAVDDRVNALVIAGIGLVRTYDDVGNTYTIDLNIPELTEDTVPDETTDYVPAYDSISLAHQKVLLSRLIAARHSNNNVSATPTNFEFAMAFPGAQIGSHYHLSDNGVGGTGYWITYKGGGLWDYVAMSQATVIVLLTYLGGLAETRWTFPLDETSGIYGYATNPAIASGRNLLLDGDMTETGVARWTANASATLTKVSGWLRVAYNGSANASASQVVLQPGVKYRIRADMRGDGLGTSIPRIVQNVVLYTGTNSGSTQSVDFYFTAVTSGIIAFQNFSSAGYVEFTNIIIEQVGIVASTEYDLTLGRLELANDPGFDYGNASWGVAANWAIAGSKATHTPGSTTILPATLALVIGKTYDVIVTVANRTAGSITPRAGSTGTGGSAITANGVAAPQTLTTSGSAVFALVPDSAFDGEITSISIKPTNNLLVLNGDGSSTTGWTAAAASLSSTGGKLRVTASGAAAGAATQNIFKIGSAYIGTVLTNGDATAVPRILNGATVLATGSSSGTPAILTIAKFIATSITLSLQANTTTISTYAEFDDIVFIEINPLTGQDIGGVTPNQDSGGLALLGRLYNGSTGVTNLYSHEINSITSLDSIGTLKVVAQVTNAGVWTDGIQRFIARLGGLSSNEDIILTKEAAANTLTAYYISGATSKSVTFTFSGTGVFVVDLVWDHTAAGEFKVYLNGTQVGTTQTGLGIWRRNLSTAATVLAASSTAAATPWNGYIWLLHHRNIAPSAATIAGEAQLAGAVP